MALKPSPKGDIENKASENSLEKELTSGVNSDDTLPPETATNADLKMAATKTPKPRKRNLLCWTCGGKDHQKHQCLKRVRSVVPSNDSPPPGSVDEPKVKLLVAEIMEAHKVTGKNLKVNRKRHATPENIGVNKYLKYSSTSIKNAGTDATTSQNKKISSAEYVTLVDKTVDLIMRKYLKTSKYHTTTEERQKKKTEVTVRVENIMAKNTLLADVVKIYAKYCKIYGKETVREHSFTRNDPKHRESKLSVHDTKEDEIFQGCDKASPIVMCRVQSAVDTIVKNEIKSDMTPYQIAEFRKTVKQDVFKSLMGKCVPQMKEIIDEYYNFLYKDFYESALGKSEQSPKPDIEKIKLAAETIVRKNFLERASKLIQGCVERRLSEMCNGKPITNPKLLIEEYEKKFGADNLPVIKPDECICMANNRTLRKSTDVIFHGPENASVKTLNSIMHISKSLCASADKTLTELQVMLMSWITRDRIFTILNGHPIPKHNYIYNIVNLYRANFDKNSDAILIRKLAKMKKGIESLSDLCKINPAVDSSKMKTLESAENGIFREYIVQHHEIVEFHSLYLRWIIRNRIYDIAEECSKSHANLEDPIQVYQTRFPLANDEQLMRNCLQGKIDWDVWKQAKIVESDDSEEKKAKEIICKRVERLLQKVVLVVKPSESEDSSRDDDGVLKEMLESKFKSMLPQLQQELVQEYSKMPSFFQDVCTSEPTDVDVTKQVCRTEITDPRDLDLEVKSQEEFDKIMTDIDQDLSELITAMSEDG